MSRAQNASFLMNFELDFSLLLLSFLSLLSQQKSFHCRLVTSKFYTTKWTSLSPPSCEIYRTLFDIYQHCSSVLVMTSLMLPIYLSEAIMIADHLNEQNKILCSSTSTFSPILFSHFSIRQAINFQNLTCEVIRWSSCADPSGKRV